MRAIRGLEQSPERGSEADALVGRGQRQILPGSLHSKVNGTFCIPLYTEKSPLRRSGTARVNVGHTVLPVTHTCIHK